MPDRRQSLDATRLYLICDAQTEGFVKATINGGVDIVQLRCKHATDSEIVITARRFGRICAEHGALLILNDRPDLVDAAGADGAHVGQDDVSPAQARALLGPARLLGLSTHTPEQIDAAGPDIDYIGVGPVFATPTKPGRAAVGTELVRHAAAHATVPFFAIGGINACNVGAVLSAGARRIAVVRALTEADDPELAARSLRAAITISRDPSGAGVGAA